MIRAKPGDQYRQKMVDLSSSAHYIIYLIRKKANVPKALGEKHIKGCALDNLIHIRRENSNNAKIVAK